MMEYISVIVKGSRFQAARAAADRGIPFVFVRETPWGETIGRTPIERRDKVVAWFHADGRQEFPGAPYLVGDCLYYSEVQ